MKTFALFLAGMLMLSCQMNSQDNPEAPQDQFGAPVSLENIQPAEAVFTALDSQDSLAAKLKVRVNAVCQKKGCWMKVQSAEDAPEMMVRFKDYGFFVPKDLAGSEVVIEGYAFKEVTPVDELRHYAEDAGKSREEIEAITEPREEYKFLASGVRIVKRSPN
ncbi:MAG: DUF4920 domain-containing protein [Bacteroidetes bacterium]|nr:MAG: DUF4920 domain-containing protein [Bacteroidota bacterium]